MHIRKDDSVKVIASRDKDKEGKIIVTESKKDRVVVEGVNVIKKHRKPTQLSPEGGILETEATTHVSNVQLPGPKTSESTRVGYKFVDGKRVRTAKKSDEEIRSSN